MMIGSHSELEFEQRNVSLRRFNSLKSECTEVQTSVSVIVTDAN